MGEDGKIRATGIIDEKSWEQGKQSKPGQQQLSDQVKTKNY